nr:hypothetical protein [Desulfobulbaceae bacterium]
MARAHNPYGSQIKASDSIDRERDRERRIMLQACYKYAGELSMKLVQKLLDNKIVETNSEQALRELFEKLFGKIADLEEFEMQFKVAPIRSLVGNANLVSLYITQYIIEDVVEHPSVQDIFGDDLEIYRVVDSVLDKIRPRH